MFSTDTATTQFYTLSLHDALPICSLSFHRFGGTSPATGKMPTSLSRDRPDSDAREIPNRDDRDRKSTRLNSSHLGISYAVFCLKKKKKKHRNTSLNSKESYTN